jgi:hypothetical protein
MLDAWLAKFAAPGMSNPADQTGSSHLMGVWCCPAFCRVGD